MMNHTNMLAAVALLNHLPALTFAKEAATGKYIACNQAFAEYANKPTPEGVIGLTDFEIFDPDTAAHFVEDDRKTLSMEEPYVFFEDVPDAAGSVIRHLQTTKQKFTDESGRICTLGICTDVTEMVEAKALEAELLADEKELAEHNMLVDLGRNDLGKISRFGTVQVEKLHCIERFSHVMHIGSTVRGEIREDRDALDAVAAVLPAGKLHQ